MLTRAERISVHKKQERLQVEKGKPSLSSLTEGVPTLRATRDGLIEYVRYNNQLYSKVYQIDKPLKKSVINMVDDGYFKIGDTFILQWGQVTADATTKTVKFPIPFPNACLNITCTDYDSGSSYGVARATAISILPTKTTVVFSAYNTADTFFWQAIGY